MLELYKNAAASVPSASTDRVRLFVDTDGLPYVKNSAGTVTAMKGATGAAGAGLAAGGTTGQVLAKVSNTDYDTAWVAPTTGSVASVTGTSPVVSSGGTNPAISLASGYGDTLNPYASKTAKYVLAAPNGAAGVPTFRALVASDIPTLDQNTTGTAANVTGIVAVANGGSGTATPSLVAGTNVTVTGTWPNQTIAATGGSGSVTDVTGTAPIVSSGGATPAISMAASYGDTQNPYASKTANFILAAPNGTAGVPTFRAVAAADIPTLNQNTTGTAANVTGTVAIANGGTGATTRQAAMDALAGSTTSGQYLRGNGTDVVMAAIVAGDVPTLNQNTTGTAANVTGIVAVANGGSGTATPSLVAGTNVTITGSWPNQTIAASGGGGGGSGTVTDVSVVSANGFAGTVATSTTTPAITLSTSITGVLKGNGTAISAATAGTDYVTPTGTETLTNKTMVFTSNTLTGVASVATTQTLTNKTLTTPTLTNPIITGAITEDVFAVVDGASVDLDPGNGTIQYWSLGANRTATATNFVSGESMTLLVNDGTAYALTWPTITWVGGSAPILSTTGYTVVELWKITTILYGAIVGYTT